MLHLFNKQYSKTSNIVKYYYNLKKKNYHYYSLSQNSSEIILMS